MAIKDKLLRFGIKPFGNRREGYTYIDTDDGKTRYGYCLEYYSRRMETERALKRRILYYVCSVLAMAAFISAGLPKTAVNTSPFMGAAICISIMLFLWLIYILIVMAFYRNCMTIGAFRVVAVQFLLNLICCSFVSALSTVFTIMYALKIGGITLWTDILGFCLRLVATGLFLTITVLEYRTEYDVILPE